MKIVSYNNGRGGIFWIRFFGVGFSIKNTKIAPLRFSERNGYTKSIRIGNFFISYLKKIAN